MHTALTWKGPLCGKLNQLWFKFHSKPKINPQGLAEDFPVKRAESVVNPAMIFPRGLKFKKKQKIMKILVLYSDTFD
jgi:hypothetical protein